MRNYKQLIIVIIISIILGLGAFLATWFSLDYSDTKLGALIFFTLWAFSLPASLVYFAIKVYPENSKGSYYGGMLFGRLSILFIFLVAPYYAYLYYVGFFKRKDNE